MLNVGEQLVTSYLRYIKKCDFVQTNVLLHSQGELDVLGLNLEGEPQTVYFCEVAIHLTTGLQYVKNGRPDNVPRLTKKFSKDIEYADKYFPQDRYTRHFMLWSPVVRDSKRGKPENNQMRHVEEIKTKIREQKGIELECIINQEFYERLKQLRDYARKQTEALPCPLARLMQIEERLKILN